MCPFEEYNLSDPQVEGMTEDEFRDVQWEQAQWEEDGIGDFL